MGDSAAAAGVSDVVFEYNIGVAYYPNDTSPPGAGPVDAVMESSVAADTVVKEPDAVAADIVDAVGVQCKPCHRFETAALALECTEDLSMSFDCDYISHLHSSSLPLELNQLNCYWNIRLPLSKD